MTDNSELDFQKFFQITRNGRLTSLNNISFNNVYIHACYSPIIE